MLKYNLVAIRRNEIMKNKKEKDLLEINNKINQITKWTRFK